MQKVNFCSVVLDTAKFISLSDPEIIHKTAIANENFDGSKESLEIALGNVCASRELREYGYLNKLPCVLSAINCLSESQIKTVCGIIVANGVDILLQITNTGCPSSVDTVLFLDMHAVLERAISLQSTDKLEPSAVNHCFSKSRPTCRRFDVDRDIDGNTDMRKSGSLDLAKNKQGIVLLIFSVAIVLIAWIRSTTVQANN